MKDLPNPFWATIFMVLGCCLLLAVLFKVNANTGQLELGVLMAVASAGTGLTTGAFGYINGHKDGVASVKSTTPGGTTSMSLGVDPLVPPVAPANPQKEG